MNTKTKQKTKFDNDILPGKLITVPQNDQPRNRIGSFKPRTKGDRVYIGVDTETNLDLGQKPRSIQIAMRTGPHSWEAYYIEDYKTVCPNVKTETFKIQGETITTTFRKMPAHSWKDCLNNLLTDPAVTLAFFNIFFDIPIIYQVNPSKDEKLNDYWFFYTDQAVRMKKLPGKRTLLIQSKYQFLDTQTAAKVLVNEASLNGAAREMLGKHKLEFDPENPKYAVWDAVLTAMLAEEIDNKIKNMGMDIRPDLIRSPATFPKYLLSSMGVRRARFNTPDIAPWWNAFFGGKIETNPEFNKQTIKGNIIYSDIKGQYAQAFKDTPAYKFMICESIEVHEDHEPDTEKLLTPHPDNAHIVVKADLKNAIVPVKTDTVNLFPITTGTGFYMLPDLWAATLLSPRCKIKIVTAYIPEAIGRQTVTPKHNLNPYDLPRDLINKRAKSKGAKNLFYKNTLNTMYGITAEGSASGKKSSYKKMGLYGNPIIAATITSYGRYLVASGEAYLKDQDTQAYYIHTDSLFIDNDFYTGLKKHYEKTHGVGLDIKGEGRGLLTISAGKYGLFEDTKGTTPAVDKNKDLHLSFHGLNEPFSLPGDLKFFDLMAENWSEAYKCYDEGADPLTWKFKGLEYLRIKTANVQAVSSYHNLRKKFEDHGHNPDLVRCGMFFYMGYVPGGTPGSPGSPGIFGTYDQAADNSQVSLSFLIRNHFSQDDQKYNYKKGRPWKVNINAPKEEKERQEQFLTDF